MSNKYAVLVSFEVEDAQRHAFLALVRANASASVEREAGCRRFDVMVVPDGHIHLYEMYDDRMVFEAHLTTEHFLSFDVATQAMIKSKQVIAGDVFENAKT